VLKERGGQTDVKGKLQKNGGGQGKLWGALGLRKQGKQGPAERK